MDINTPEGMKAAVAWQMGWVSKIKDGGAWVVPAAMIIIKIHHSRKIALFNRGVKAAPDIARVFNAMGWRCYDGMELPTTADDPETSFSA